MHDTGVMKEPKEGGPMARLIASVMAAKDYNDTYLTEIIDKEKSQKRKEEGSPETKKTKMSEKDAQRS